MDQVVCYELRYLWVYSLTEGNIYIFEFSDDQVKSHMTSRKRIKSV